MIGRGAMTSQWPTFSMLVVTELHPCGMLLITATEPLVQYTPTPVTHNSLQCPLIYF